MEKKKTKGGNGEPSQEAEKATGGQTAADGAEAASGASAEKSAERSAEKAAGKPQKSEAEEALEKAIADAEDYKRKWYSVSAEYENYRKRTARESAQRYADGRADVIVKLFPIADNLERAYASCSDEATKKGVSMVLDAFNKLLEGERVTAIDPTGDRFDAEKHEAIMAVDAADGEESGTVKQVYLKGYERDGKVLRFAQVVVVK